MGGDRDRDTTDGDTSDGDMTGQDPMSSTAEGDEDPGTAALAGAGTEAAPDDHEQGGEASSPTTSPPPEAYDATPVTDAVPEENLGYPDA